MLVLILDARTALDGAQAGVALCIRTLVPSLFPFFIFSILLTSTLRGQVFHLLRPLEQLCRIPAGSGALLAVGLLGGYPTGAQNVALAYRTGALSKQDAERMLGFCNNAGPAFLFGMVGQFFDSPQYPWLLWLIHILSTLLTALILPGAAHSGGQYQKQEPVTLAQAMDTAVRVMGTVCGWVVFFRIVIEFLERWIFWLLPQSLQIFCKGILELSNGCVLLGQITNVGLRFLLASVLLAFGGLCVAMQTRSVTAGLSTKRYFPGKLLQSSISLFLALLAQRLFPQQLRYTVSAFLELGVLAALVISVFLLRNQKNKSSIPAVIGV